MGSTCTRTSLLVLRMRSLVRMPRWVISNVSSEDLYLLTLCTLALEISVWVFSSALCYNASIFSLMFAFVLRVGLWGISSKSLFLLTFVSEHQGRYQSHSLVQLQSNELVMGHSTGWLLLGRFSYMVSIWAGQNSRWRYGTTNTGRNSTCWCARAVQDGGAKVE
jgi:hypothetical protein